MDWNVWGHQLTARHANNIGAGRRRPLNRSTDFIGSRTSFTDLTVTTVFCRFLSPSSVLVRSVIADVCFVSTCSVSAPTLRSLEMRHSFNLMVARTPAGRLALTLPFFSDGRTLQYKVNAALSALPLLQACKFKLLC